MYEIDEGINYTFRARFCAKRESYVSQLPAAQILALTNRVDFSAKKFFLRI